MINLSKSFIIAQLIGLSASIVLIISFNKNKKEDLLKYQVLSSLLFGLQIYF